MLSCSACVKWTTRLLAVALAGVAACGPYTIFGNTTSLGGTTPGGRGKIKVSFVNNTPYRALFTYGVYDAQSIEFTPQFGQMVLEPRSSSSLDGRLEGNSTSPVFTLSCARVFSIGGLELIDRIKVAKLDTGLDEEAFQPGIGFSDKALGDAEAGIATKGRIDEVVTNQGTEFPCDALLIYTFTVDTTATGGVRVDLQVIPSE
jgi:hypothetical protein